MSRASVQSARTRLRATEDEVTRASTLLSVVGEFAAQRERGAPADPASVTSAFDRFVAPGPMNRASRRAALSHLRDPFEDGNHFFALARAESAAASPSSVGDASLSSLLDALDDFQAGEATATPATDTFETLVTEGSAALADHLVTVVTLLAESARSARDRARADLSNAYPADAVDASRIEERGAVQEYVDSRADPIADLEEHPIALLPVKLETRFARPPERGHKDGVANPELYTDMDGPELWVRVYPDAIHVDNHEPQLTETEVRLGKDFWAYCWYATHQSLPIDGDAASERAYLSQHLDERRTDVIAGLDPAVFPTDPVERKTRIKERAWTQLLDRFGRERAAYVVHRMAPDEGADTDARVLLSLSSAAGDAEMEPGEGDTDGDVDASADDDASVTERFEGVERRSATTVDGVKPNGDVPSLSFPDPDRRPDSWTRPPEARLLPDQWLVYGVWQGDGERETFLTTTDAVRDPLPVGPSPEALSLAHPDRGGDGSESDEADAAVRWLTDFGEAEKAGMAFRITGSSVFDDTDDTDADASPDRPAITDGRFETLIVTGVKSSMDHRETARELEELFEAHHYTDGLELLDVGTPTNNHDRRSGYAASDDPTESMAVETTAMPLVRHGDNSGGDRLARALAIDPGPSDPHVFGRVEGADSTEWLDGWHMRTALWPATAGYYLSNMLVDNAFAGSKSLWDDDGGDATARETPTVAEARERFEWFEAYRSHFTHFVSPYGPLSSFRVDTQPYGVLPVTPMADARADVYDVDDDASLALLPGLGDRDWTVGGSSAGDATTDQSLGGDQDLVSKVASAAMGSLDVDDATQGGDGDAE
jgi:hypothetical protein